MWNTLSAAAQAMEFGKAVPGALSSPRQAPPPGVEAQVGADRKPQVPLPSAPPVLKNQACSRRILVLQRRQ